VPTGYLALNGFLPGGLSAIPDDYRVRRTAPEVAVATTAPNDRGSRLRVVWHLRPDGWRVNRMDELPADAAARRALGPVR
jgi:hypothetical protein